MKLLVCGGLGFIGSAFIRNHLQNFNDQIINVDNFSYGSNKKNLENFDTYENYKFVNEDIRNYEKILGLSKDVDIIVNFAAESHVDRSIANPKSFLETNILGTFSLLETAKKLEKFFVHISTDEIYGSVKNNSFTENDKLSPTNPYSVSKAAADLLVNSYFKTYDIKCVSTRCTNNFGPFQFPEKLIPKTIIRAIKNLKIPLYGGGSQIRSWIYVLDHVNAIEAIIKNGKIGETYNISARNEITNRKVVEKILKILDKSDELIEDVTNRPGHDERYSIDSTKIEREIGWKPHYDFENALLETVQWYINNQSWWEPLADERTLHPQPWTLDW